MKPIAEWDTSQYILFLIFLNIILKLGFLFINVVPSDVSFMPQPDGFY